MSKSSHMYTVLKHEIFEIINEYYSAFSILRTKRVSEGIGRERDHYFIKQNSFHKKSRKTNQEYNGRML